MYHPEACERWEALSFGSATWTSEADHLTLAAREMELYVIKARTYMFERLTSPKQYKEYSRKVDKGGANGGLNWRGASAFSRGQVCRQVLIARSPLILARP